MIPSEEFAKSYQYMYVLIYVFIIIVLKSDFTKAKFESNFCMIYEIHVYC